MSGPMTEPLRVGVDIDDVLFPWYDKAHAACIAAGIAADDITPTTWSPHEEYGCTLQDWLDALEVVTLDGSLYAGAPYPGAVEALQRIHDAGHTIHLVTARGFFVHGHLIRSQTVDWLAEYDVPHHSLTFSKDKRIVPCDVFVDDYAKNVSELTAAGVRTWMVTRPHNQTVDHPLRVTHIGEFADAILEAS